MNKVAKRLRYALSMLALCTTALCGSASLHAGEYLDPTKGIQLGEAAQTTLNRQNASHEFAAAENYQKPQIRPIGNGLGTGTAKFANGVFVGQFRKVKNPYSGNFYWTLYKGTYQRLDEVRYLGIFHYFHRDGGAYSYYEEDWILANAGRYFLVGNRIAADGSQTPGIYSAPARERSLPDFTRADSAYLAEFERRYSGQINAFKRAQADKDSHGLSFGQVLALGLGAAVLGQADIPGADAARIGGAFAADILTDGRAGALTAIGSPSRDATKYHPAATTDNAAKVATASFTTDSVTVSCPSGASRKIPIKYKTQSCRNAMVEFARAYSCNLIDDFAAVGQRCQSACGHPQCLQ